METTAIEVYAPGTDTPELIASQTLTTTTDWQADPPTVTTTITDDATGDVVSTETREATPEELARWIVATGGTALRVGPGTDAPVVTTLAQGTAVTATGPTDSTGGITYTHITSDALSGWVRASALIRP